MYQLNFTTGPTNVLLPSDYCNFGDSYPVTAWISVLNFGSDCLEDWFDVWPARQTGKRHMAQLWLRVCSIER